MTKMKEQLEQMIAELIRKASTPEIAARAIVEAYMRMEEKTAAEMEERRQFMKDWLSKALRRSIKIIQTLNIDQDQEPGRKYVLSTLERIKEEVGE